MTCYSNKEELTNEIMFGSKLVAKLEDLLHDAGANIDNGFPMFPHIVRDRELVTGIVQHSLF